LLKGSSEINLERAQEQKHRLLERKSFFSLLEESAINVLGFLYPVFTTLPYMCLGEDL
jgi:hypothetical protein